MLILTEIHPFPCLGSRHESYAILVCSTHASHNVFPTLGRELFGPVH